MLGNAGTSAPKIKCSIGEPGKFLAFMICSWSQFLLVPSSRVPSMNKESHISLVGVSHIKSFRRSVDTSGQLYGCLLKGSTGAEISLRSTYEPTTLPAASLRCLMLMMNGSVRNCEKCLAVPFQFIFLKILVALAFSLWLIVVSYEMIIPGEPSSCV